MCSASRTSLRRIEIGVLDDLFSYLFAGAQLQVRGSFGPLAESFLPPDRIDCSMVDEREEEAPERSPARVAGFRGPPQGRNESWKISQDPQPG
jgi:hypothetical protein